MAELNAGVRQSKRKGMYFRFSDFVWAEFYMTVALVIPPLGDVRLIGQIWYVSYCKAHYYCALFNFTHFALVDDNAYITGADIRSE